MELKIEDAFAQFADMSAKTISKLGKRLDDLELKIGRMGIPSYAPTTGPRSEKLAEWENYLRYGVGPTATKALSETGQAGVLAPEDFRSEVVKALAQAGVMRRLARRLETTYDVVNLPAATSSVQVGWLAENSQLLETEPNFANIQFRPQKLGALTRTSRELLTDSRVDVLGLLTQLFAEAIAAAEDAAFFLGDGNGKPLGILAEPAGGPALPRVTTAAVGAVSADDIIRTFYELPAQYRANAVWVMNSKIEAVVRQLKDNAGSYLWAPNLQQGAPGQLLGRPVFNFEGMADTITGGADVLLLADFSRAYYIVDRAVMEVRRSDDRYFELDQIAFAVTTRTDGKIVLPDAGRVLRVKAA